MLSGVVLSTLGVGGAGGTVATKVLAVSAFVAVPLSPPFESTTASAKAVRIARIASPFFLFAHVPPRSYTKARAKSRGLDPSELQDFYRQRNLLKATVTAEHVGNAVVFFATNQTPTTGATLPVDGGVAEAFPR